MDQEFELCVCDIRQVLHHQLATPQFATEFDTAPYRQFQADSQQVWSNLMSGDWAWRKAVCVDHSLVSMFGLAEYCYQDYVAMENRAARGAMLVTVITGLDKATVSVRTGHQESHPMYASPGNLTNV